jgi:hypothetical protein
LLIKLVLISQREMVPELADAVQYVSVSVDDLDSVFSGAAEHAPGASLVMALARSLGIPYRIFMDVFLALAAFLFLRPLVASMRQGIVAVGFTYGLLLFHPALILEMDRAMSDSVGFLWWLIGAGGIIGFVAAPREKLPRWSLGLAIASFAFAGITRSGEGAIVFVEMVAVALLSVVLFRGVDSWRGRRAVVACLCAVAANFAATQALSAAHFVKSGYWGVTAVESREWWQLYSSLLSLPVQRDDRHVLINKATMEMAEALSEDLRSMSGCFEEIEAKYSSDELPNEGVQWVIIHCLPGGKSSKPYAMMHTISTRIIDAAREHQLQLSAPVLGIIPHPAAQWLSYLPSSILRVAFDAVQIPSSTRVSQNYCCEELFNRGLLRRSALVAKGENSEVVGYKSFIRILYAILAALFWPSVPVFLAVAVIVIRSPITAMKSGLITFAIFVMIIDVLCRISFYSIVDWIMWDVEPRYVLGPSVLTVLIVSTLLTMWLVPAVGSLLGSMSIRGLFEL